MMRVIGDTMKIWYSISYSMSFFRRSSVSWRAHSGATTFDVIPVVFWHALRDGN
jgi:hypothetical protein